MSGDHKERKTGEDNRKEENDIAWSREIKGTKADSARDEKKKVEEKYNLFREGEQRVVGALGSET